MGRPRKKPGESYSEHINVRYRPDEYKHVTEQANKAGMSPSEFVRQASVKGTVITQQAANVPTVDRAYVNQLIRIGNNLNQLALAYYRKDQLPPPEHVDLLDKINDIIDETI